MNEITEYAEKLNHFLHQRETIWTQTLSNPEMSFAQECLFAKQQILKNSKSCEVAIGNQLSLHDAILNVAAIGLTLNPALSMAFLIPRDGKIVLDISYRGLIKLATDTGIIKWARAELVYQHDKFEYRGAFEAPTITTTDPFGNRGEIVGVYCVAKTASGDSMTEIMSVEEINKIRDSSIAYKSAVSKGKTNSVWHQWYGEMAKKSVIKRASKTWPYSGKTRLDKAIDVVNQHEGLTTSFSPAQKEDFDHYLNSSPVDFFSMVKTMPQSIYIDLYNSAPTGQKGKFKKLCDETMIEGQSQCDDIITDIEDKHRDDQPFAALELIDELESTTKAYIISRLDEGSKNWIEKAIDNAG